MSHEAMNDTSEVARRALERVCSGGRQDPPVWYYSPSFVDHVNGREFHGLEGVEESVASYRRVIRNMSILVEQQVVDGDLVTSRFTVSGSVWRKPVEFGGITISRFENGKIAEDWSVTDTGSLLRQVGLLRGLLMLVRS